MELRRQCTRSRTGLLVRALAVTLPAVLGLSGCGFVILGAPSFTGPSSDSGNSRGPAGEVTIVGAVEGSVDDLSRDALADLEEYWSGAFPEVFGTDFQPLAGGYFSVDPNDVDPGEYPNGVGCGAAPLEVASNAFYCQAPNTRHSDSITYDRAFLEELADGYGQFLPALVMAHEFGHAVQARVGSPPSSIATETQADCHAGAWSAWVAEGNAEHSRLSEADLDELLRGYFLLRDPVGTSTGQQSAHGSYFDRVSAFQEGFDSGPDACRDNFGRDRLFTQGSFRDDDEALSGGNAGYAELLRIVDTSLPAVWEQAFRDVFDETFTAPDIRSFDGEAPACSPDTDRDLVYCSEATLVAFDESDLARPAYELGDFAVATAVAIPYSLSVRDQLGRSVDDENAFRSALCLTGWYAAKVFNGQAGGVSISPGDLDESVQFLLIYGTSPTVVPDVELSGFQQVDLFRSGFVEGLGSCDVGA
jgi:predicted metalloprotease